MKAKLNWKRLWSLSSQDSVPLTGSDSKISIYKGENLYSNCNVCCCKWCLKLVFLECLRGTDEKKRTRKPRTHPHFMAEWSNYCHDYWVWSWGTSHHFTGFLPIILGFTSGKGLSNKILLYCPSNWLIGGNINIQKFDSKREQKSKYNVCMHTIQIKHDLWIWNNSTANPLLLPLGRGD